MSAQSTYALKTIIQHFQKLCEQRKSKGGWRDFSPAGKNEAIIAKSPLPVPFPLWVLRSRYETHHIILLQFQQNQAELCGHVGRPWKPNTCGLVNRKRWVPPCAHLAWSGAQAPPKSMRLWQDPQQSGSAS